MSIKAEAEAEVNEVRRATQEVTVVRDQTSSAIANRRATYIADLTSYHEETAGTWLATQSKAKQARIKQKVQGPLKHGLNTIAALQCFGPAKCPFYNSCPIPDKVGAVLPLDEYPIGSQCVLESEYTSQRVVDYIQQLNVDPFNTIEMSLIEELALLDLFRNRAVLVLAQGDRRGHGRDLLTIDESIVGFSADGEPLTSQATKIHPAVEIMDKHEKRRARILEQFVATRASKFKLQGGQVDSNTELFQSIQAIKGWMEQVSKQGITMGSGHTGLGDSPRHTGLFIEEDSADDPLVVERRISDPTFELERIR